MTVEQNHRLTGRDRRRRRRRNNRVRGLFERLESRWVLTNEVVFVDPSVWDDQPIPISLQLSADVVVLDADRDGVHQMADYLRDVSDLSAIHIVSHGQAGRLSQLGSVSLTADDLSRYSSELATIGASLSDGGDLLLWGCDVAAGDGVEFVHGLARATGADVAASDNLSGTGGDWELELTTGPVESADLLARVDPDITLSHFRGGSVTNTVSAAGLVELEVFSAWEDSVEESPAFVLFQEPSAEGNFLGNFIQQSHDEDFARGSELGGSEFAVARTTFTFDLAAAGHGAGTYYAVWQSGARVAGIQNPGGASIFWELETAIVWDGTNASASPTLLPATVDIIAQGHAYTQYLNSTDPDGTPVNYEFVEGTADPHYGPASQISGINLDELGGINVSAANTAALSQGRWVYKVRATDGQGAYSERDVLVAVEDPLNLADQNLEAPVLTPIGSRIVPVGTPISIPVSGTDAGNAEVTVRSQLLPAGAQMSEAAGIGSATSVFTWTPQPGQEGIYFVNFETFESGEAVPIIDNELVRFEVIGANNPPVLNPIGNKAVPNGGSISFTVSGSDPDGDNLTYSSFFLPPGASFDPLTRVFTWTPPPSQYNNTFTGMTFLVTDDGIPNLTDQETITVTIGDGNHAPEFSPLPDLTVQVGTDIVVNSFVSDTSSGQVITLADVVRPIGSTFTATPGTTPVTGIFSWTPTAADVGVHTVRFRAEDNGNPILSSTEEFTITVLGAADPPLLGPLGLNANSIDEGQTATLSGTFFDPSLVDTHTVLIDWGGGGAGQPSEGTTILTTAGSNPPGTTLTNLGGGNWSFSATHVYSDDNPSASGVDNYTISVVVTDSQPTSDSASIAVEVKNVAPQAQDISVTSPTVEGSPTTLTATIVDPGSDTFVMDVDWGDGSTNTFVLGLAPLSGLDVNGDAVTWDPTSGALAIAHTYVDDQPTATAVDTVNLVITALSDDDGGHAGIPVDAGGGLFLTGHAVLLNGQNGLDTVMLDYLRGAGTPLEIPRAEYDIAYFRTTPRGVPGDGAFGSVTEASPSTIGGATAFANFLSGADVLYIPWVFDVSGASGSNVLNGFAPEVSAFLAAGGDIVVESSGGLPTFYDFLPSGLAPTSVNIAGNSGFSLTPTGQAIGITPSMIEGFDVHSRFTAFDESYSVLEQRGADVISIARRTEMLGPVYTSTLNITNAAPEILNWSTGVRSIDETEAVSVEGTFRDAGVADTHTVVIDWGGGIAGQPSEGTTTLTTVGPNPPGTTLTSLGNGDWSFSASHVYSDDNPTGTLSDSYSIQLTVTDDDTGAVSDDRSVTVNNVAPVLSPLVLSSAVVPEDGNVTVSGTFSDVGVDTHTVVINWGGGIGGVPAEGTTTLTTSGPNPAGTSFTDLGNGSWEFSATHEYLTNSPFGSSYTISVDVTDDDTGSATDTAVVTVDDAAPQLGPLVFDSSPATEGQAVTLSGTFTDPGTVNTHTLVIDWGGGAAGQPAEGTTTITTVGPNPAGTVLTDEGGGNWSFSATHVYVDDDPTSTELDAYTVSVTLTDNDAAVSTASEVLNVSNAAPVLDPLMLDASNLSEGGTVSLTGTFRDAGLSDTHTVLIDWGGDGAGQPLEGTTTLTTAGPNPTGTTLADEGGGVWRFTATHTYGDDHPTATLSDNYTVQVTVTDDDGGAVTGDTTLQVDNTAPVLSGLELSATSINESGSVTVSGTFTDVGANDTHELVIDWGGARQAAEGTTTLTTLGPNPTGTTLIDEGGGVWRFSATHHYADDNPTATSADDYTIQVSVTDDDGGNDVETGVVTVNNVAPEIQDVTITSPTAEGGFATLSGTIVDPGTDVFEMDIRWGDGTSHIVVLGTAPMESADVDGNLITWDPATGAFAIEHRYVDDDPTGTPSDTYSIVISSVTDDDGGAAGTVTETAGGNVFLTGHSVLLHDHQNGFDTAVLDFLRGAGTASEIPRAEYDIGYLRTIDRGLPGSGAFGNVVTATPSGVAIAGAFTAFLSSVDVLYVPWTFDLGGSLASTILNQLDDEVEAFWNAGGDILVESSGGAPTFYNFLPTDLIPTVQAINGGTGFSPTPAGQIIGITDAMINGHDSHNRFLTYDEGYTEFEVRGSDVISIGRGPGVASVVDGLQVTVENVAPTINAIAPGASTINEDQAIEFTGTFFDPGLNDSHVVSIDWDGPAEFGEVPTTLTLGGPNPSGATLTNLGGGNWSFSALHRYRDDNPTSTGTDDFTIHVSVTDDDGGVATDETVVTVQNVAPSLEPLTLDMTELVEGDTVVVTGTFTDVGTRDLHSIVVDWGGGSAGQDSEGTTTISTVGPNPAGTTLTDLGGGTWRFSAEHEYSDDQPTATASDSYTISVSVTDDDSGNANGSASLSVGNSAPLLVTLDLDEAEIDEDGLAVVSGSFRDAGILDTHTIVIDWGGGASGQPAEGTTTLTTVGPNPAGTTLTNLGSGEWSFSASHLYSDDNPTATVSDEYSIQVTVTDDDTGSVSDNRSVTVRNVAPVLAPLVLSSTMVPEDGNVTVSGTFSDVGVDTHTVVIDWGGGIDGVPAEGTTTLTTSGPNPAGTSLTDLGNGSWEFSATHEYLTNSPLGSSYTISVDVTDDDMGSVTDTAVVSVDDAAPQLGPLLFDSSPATEGQAVTLSGTFTDPGTVNTHTLVIDWGGGATGQPAEGTTTITTLGPNPAGTVLTDEGGGNWSFSATHVYVDDDPTSTESDAYTVSVTLTDNDAAVSTASEVLTVSNAAPVLDPLMLDASSLSEGGTVSLTGTFRDAGLSDTHTVLIDWGGDGAGQPLEGTTTLTTAGPNPTGTTLTDEGGGVWRFTATHTYGDDHPTATLSDNYTVQVTVTDDDGGAVTGDTTLQVDNTAPVLSGLELSATSINESGSVTISGTFTDVGANDTHELVIDWGGGAVGQAAEGTTTLTTLGPNPTGTTLIDEGGGVWRFSATHQYADDNPTATSADDYTIQVSVTDDDGGNDVETGVVTVSNVVPVLSPLVLSASVVPEDGNVTVSGTFSDVGVDTHTVVIDWGGGVAGIPAEGTITLTTLGPNPAGTSLTDLGNGSWEFSATHEYLTNSPLNSSYTISVEVTDDDTGSATDTAVVTVEDAAPQLGPLLFDSSPATEGQTVTLSGTFTDPGTVNTHTLVIDWGGGAAGQPAEGTTTITTVGPNPAGTVLTDEGGGNWSFSATHVYVDDDPTSTESDAYTVSVTLTDNDAAVSTASEVLNVSNAAPVLDPLMLDASSLSEGGTVSLTGTFRDAGLSDTHTVLINWGGDGAGQPLEGTTTLTTAGPNPTGTTLTDEGGGVWRFTATHTYGDDHPTATLSDNYTVQVTVTDDDGGAVTGDTTLQVDNTAPVLSGLELSATSINESGSVTVSGTFTDVGANDTHELVIDWGGGAAGQAAEGTTTLTTLGPSPADTELTNEGGGVWRFSATHQYADDNPTATSADAYTVQVSVTDDDGGNDVETGVVTVNNVAPQMDTFNVDAAAVDESGSVTVTGTFQELGGGDTHQVVIDWGGGLAGQDAEGTTTLTTAGPNPAGTELTDQGGGIWRFSATHVYADDDPTGTPEDAFTIRATVTDDDGGATQAEAVVSVTNLSPVLTSVSLASTEIDEAGVATITGTFTDPGLSDSHEVLIDWGGGGEGQTPEGIVRITTAGPNPAGTELTNEGDGTWRFSATHQYADDSPTATPVDQYQIQLTVSDDDGGTVGDLLTLQVMNVAPQLEPLNLSAATIAESGSVTVMGVFADPGGLDTHGIVIDWGGGASGQSAEGTTSITTVGPNPDGTSLQNDGGIWTFSATHQYADDSPSGTPSDSYTIRATVTDDDGGVATEAATLQVDNVAPTLGAISLSSTDITESEELTVSGSFADPGTSDTHEVVVDWDGPDQNIIAPTVITSAGPNPQGTTLTNDAGVWRFSATHRYVDDNPSATSVDDYVVQIAVADDDGGTNAAEASLSVTNLPPQLQPLTLSSEFVEEGTAFTLTGEFFDAGLSDTHVVLIDWGGGAEGQPLEGTTQLATLQPLPPGATLTDLGNGNWRFTATHTYVDDNPTVTASDNYSIVAVVTDDDGGSATEERVATVNNANPVLDPLVLSTTVITDDGNVVVSGTFVDQGLADTHEVEIQWGAGEGVTTLTTAGPNPAGTTFSDLGSGRWAFAAPHEYLTSAGSADRYEITVRVTDDDGGDGVSSATVTVNNAAPQLAPLELSSPVLDESGTVTVTGTFSDLGLLDTHTVVVDWGGGTGDQPAEGTTILTTAGPNPANTSFVDLGDGNWQFTASHLYADDQPTSTDSDTYTITVTVTDQDGDSANRSLPLQVNNAPPELTSVQFAESINEGGLLTVSGVFNDPGLLDSHVIAIHWGGGVAGQADEGTTTLTSAGPNPEGTTLEQLGGGDWRFTASHPYVDDDPTGTSADTYAVEVSITDDDGGGVQQTIMPSVVNVPPAISTFELSTTASTEGQTVVVNGTFFDPGLADSHTVVVSWGGGSAGQADEGTTTLSTAGPNPTGTALTDLGDGNWSFTASHLYSDDNPTATSDDEFTIGVEVRDDDGGTASQSELLTLANASPQLGPLSLSEAEVSESGTVTLSGTFSDAGLFDTHTIVIDWGGPAQAAEGITTLTTAGPNPEGTTLVDQGNGDWSFSASHHYADDRPTGTPFDDYVISVAVTDDDGGSDSADATLRVSNVGPEIVSSELSDTTIDEAGAVTVTGTFFDPGLLDSHEVLIEWGEGATTTLTSAVPVVSDGALTDLGDGNWAFEAMHQYADDNPTSTAADNYVVRVRVSDDDLGSSIQEQNLIVNNVAPVIDSPALDAIAIVEGSTVALTGTFFDPGLSDLHTVRINWGGQGDQPAEGETVIQTGATNPPGTALVDLGSGVWSFTAAHQYQDDHPSASPADLYVVDLEIVDDDGGVASVDLQLTVENAAPTIESLELSEVSITEGGLVTLTGVYSDVGLSDAHTVTIEWAEEQPSEGATAISTAGPNPAETTLTALGDGRWRFTATHRYLDDLPTQTNVDDYTVAVTVADDDGATVATTVELTVANQGPDLSPLTIDPVSVDEGGTVTVSGTFFDPGLTDTHRLQVDWGGGDTGQAAEGVQEITVAGPNPAGASLTDLGGGNWAFVAQHRYLDDNPTETDVDTYRIAVTVTDDDGDSSSEQGDVSVQNVAPVPGPLVPSSTTLPADGAITVTGTFFDAGSADSHSITLDWGDGVTDPFVLTTAGPNPAGTEFEALGAGSWRFSATHVYAAVNRSYTISATLSDDDGGASETAITVGVDNTAPVISAVQVPPAIQEGEVLNLSGTFSDTGLTDTHTVVIDWGGQGTEGTTTLTTVGPNPTGTELVSLGDGNWRFSATHTYRDDNPTATQQDNYSISVAVTDDQQASDVATQTIEVRNADPVLEPLVLSATQISEGTELTVTGVFTDPGTLDAHSVVVDWGGGSAEQAAEGTVTITSAGGIPAGTTFVELDDGRWQFSATHTYTDDHPTGSSSDDYTVSVRVADDDAGEASATAIVTVQNAVPLLDPLALNSAQIDEGGEVMVTGTFVDAGSDSHVVVIDWGGGSNGQSSEGSTQISTSGPNPADTTLVSLGDGRWQFTAKHRYLDDQPGATAADEYLITATVTDDDTGADTATATVTVRNVAPTLGPLQLSAAVIDENGDVMLTGSFTDPGVQDTHTILIDWGGGVPGQVPEGTITISTNGGNGQSTFSASHRYLDDNPTLTEVDEYTISVTIVDDDTGESATATTLAVRNLAPVLDPIEVSASALDEGQEVTVTGTFLDPGLLDWHRVSIVWGDGLATELSTAGPNPSGTTFQNLGGGRYGFSAAYVYEDDDPTATLSDRYEIEVIVTDDDGGQSREVAPLTVNNVAPELQPVQFSSLLVSEGSELVVTGVFSDPGSEDTHTVTIDWGGTGAGQSNEGQTVFTTGGTLPAGVELSRTSSDTWMFRATHRYADDDPTATESDSYLVTVTVADDDGGASSQNASIEVANVAPLVEEFSVTAGAINEGDLVTLSARIVDPGLLDTHTIEIDWGGDGDGQADEGGVSFSAQGAIPVGVTLTDEGNGVWSLTATHRYADDDPTVTPQDVYQVSLSVTDDDGGSAVEAADVVVRNVAPTVETLMLDTTTLAENGTVTLSGSFADPGLRDSHTVEINWGGGGPGQPPEGTTVIATDAGNGNFTFTATHRYFDDNPTGTESDDYVIVVNVVDDDGGSSTASRTVEVTNQVPSLDSLLLDPVEVDEGGMVTLTGRFRDPGLFDSHVVVVQWSDGGEPTRITTFGPNPAGTTITNLGNGEWQFTAQRLLVDDNPTLTPSDTYLIDVTITDDDLGVATGQANLTVNNLPPTLDPLVLSSPTVAGDRQVTVTGTFQDLGTADSHTILLDWGGGDGRPDEGETSFTTTELPPDGVVLTELGDGRWQFTASHQYSSGAAGTYTVLTTVTDDDGGSVVQSATVTVANTAPAIESMTLAANAIGEGSQATLTAVFLDDSDAHQVVINWDSGGTGGSLTTITTAGPNPAGATLTDLGGGRWQVVASQLYADDNPTATPADLYEIRLTVNDQEQQSATETVELSVDNRAPQLAPLQLSASSVTEGGQVALLATYSDPGVADTHSVVVDWGDGTTTTLPADGAGEVSLTQTGPGQWRIEASHSYADDDPTVTPIDQYQIAVTVIDDDGGRTGGTATVEVANSAPEITGLAVDAATVDENGWVQLTGSFTDVGDRDTHSIVIDWGEAAGHASEGTTTVTSSGPNPFGASLSREADGSWLFHARHRYRNDDPAVTEADEYLISLTVADDDFGADSASRAITVNNVAPAFASFEVDSPTINEDGTVTVRGLFIDPGLMDQHTLVIDWGGGGDTGQPHEGTTVLTTEAAEVVGAARDTASRPRKRFRRITNLGDGRWEFVATHQYFDDSPTATEVDAYTITATVSDSDSGTAVATTSVAVRNVAPAVQPLQLDATAIDENGEIVLTGVFSDARLDDDHTIVIDWGGTGDAHEGTTTLTTSGPNAGGDVIPLGDGSWSFTATHQYRDDRPTTTGVDIYTIDVSVADDDGGVGTASRSLPVRNVAPQVELQLVTPASIEENGQATIRGVYSDVGTADTHEVVIDWGDGTFTTPESVTQTGTGEWQFTASHQYLDDNLPLAETFTITASVTDDDAGVGNSDVQVAVANAAPVVRPLSLSAGNIFEGESVTLSGIFTDFGTADTHAIVVDWGTGDEADILTITTEGPNPVGTQLSNLGSGVWSFSATHLYLDDAPTGTGADEVPISVSVTDDDGGVGIRATTLSVNDVAPALEPLTINTAAIDEAGDVTVSGVFHDPGLRDTFRIIVDWARNAQVRRRRLSEGLTVITTEGPNPEGTTLVDLGNGSWSFSATHQYLDDNPAGDPSDTYLIDVVVRDDDGQSSNATTAVLVSNLKPTFEIGSLRIETPEDPQPTAGGPILLSLDFNDPGVLDTHDVVIVWGDGDVSDTTVSLSDLDFPEFDGDGGGSGTFTAMHVYMQPGVFEVDIMVIDDDGGIASMSTEVEVVARATQNARLRPAWQNPLNRFDVNADGQVTAALDVEPLLAELSRPQVVGDAGQLPPRAGAPSLFYDVNGDNRVTAVDDLLALLNRLSELEEAESPPLGGDELDSLAKDVALATARDRKGGH